MTLAGHAQGTRTGRLLGFPTVCTTVACSRRWANKQQHSAVLLLEAAGARKAAALWISALSICLHFGYFDFEYFELEN